MTAINLLTLGKSVVAVAASLKLDPSTIHRWKASSPLFIAELNRRQVDAFDSLIVKMRLLMGSAVDELFQMMKSPSKSDRHEVMWKMLAMLKPQKSIIPNGPTEPEDVIDQQIRRERAARGEIAEAPIEDEDRLAHVRAEDLVEPVGRAIDRSTGRSDGRTNDDADCHAERTREASSKTVRTARENRKAPAPRGQILHEYVQDDGSAHDDHAERSEASGPIAAQGATSSSNTSRRAKTTPLPSREGLGEGARGGRNLSDADRATADTKQVSRSDAVEEPQTESLATHFPHSQILHESVQDDATGIGEGDRDDIDSRPLPRPHPQGEGSQDTALDESASAAERVSSPDDKPDPKPHQP